MTGGPKLHLVETMVSWIAPQVMVFLGKVRNPVTDKTERDLHGARALIDLLAELEEKTEGRLADDERKLLQKTLTELRLNYLDEMGKPEPAGGGESVPADESPPPATPAGSQSEESPVAGEAPTTAGGDV